MEHLRTQSTAALTLGLLRRADEIPKLVRTLERMDDVQIAAELDSMDAAAQDRVFAHLPVERRALVLESMRYEVAARVVHRLAPDEAASLLDDLDSEDAADILQRLEPERIKEILARFEPEEQSEVEDLLAYEPQSAGGIMSPDAPRLRSDMTVRAAIESLQQVADFSEDTFSVFVVDEDERLVGEVSMASLVISPPDTPLRQIMRGELITVGPEVDREIVADLAGRYDLVAVPVVDAQRRMLGVITIDDIVDVLREEATEDILKMAGAGEMLIDTAEFWTSFRARLPWLLLTAAGGMLVATGLSGFADALRVVPALALFMPVVAGMGGNVGTQSSTVLVRGLAVGYITSHSIRRVIVREVALGASLGMLCGVVVSLATPMFTGSWAEALRLGGVVALGVTGSTTIAATVGTCVPIALGRLRIDPAIATGPFVTTSVDMLGLLVYFALATILLGVAI